MRRALRASSSAIDREVFHSIRERDVGVTAFEESDQMFSQVRIWAEFCHVLTSIIKAPRMPPLVEFRDVSYSVGNRAVLQNIELRVDSGETVVLLGRSGSGKTTLLKTVNRLIKPTSGEVRFQ